MEKKIHIKTKRIQEEPIEFLYNKFPDYTEGDLSKLRASLVCEPTLSYCSDEIDIERYIRLAGS